MVFFIPGDDQWDWREAFSIFNHLIAEQAKDELCNKTIETWKLKILQANWNVELKSPGMEHGFLSQNELYYTYLEN